MRKSRKGQSTLEYVIILAAVVGGIILVASSLSTKIQTGYDDLGDKVKTAIGTAKTSF